MPMKFREHTSPEDETEARRVSDRLFEEALNGVMVAWAKGEFAEAAVWSESLYQLALMRAREK